MNSRPSWEESFLKTALEISKHSTCIRVQVGAVLTKDNRILSVGYNGTPKGKQHCCDFFTEKFAIKYSELNKNSIIDEEFKTMSRASMSLWDNEYEGLDEKKEFNKLFDISLGEFIKTDEFKKEHLEFSEKNELHAELNCLTHCALNGISTKDTVLYCTLSPCSSCAKQIVAAGIKKYIYLNKYDRDVSGIDFLNDNGIECIQTMEKL